MAAITAIAAVVSAGIGVAGYMSSLDAAEEAEQAGKEARAARRKQAKWIRDTQIGREEDLHGQEVAMLTSEMEGSKEQAQIALESGEAEVEMMEKRTESTLQTGVAKQVQDAIFSMRKGSEAVHQTAATSGFAGSGALDTAMSTSERDISSSQMLAGEAAMSSYTLGMEGADVAKENLESQYDIAIKGADMAFDRSKFGAYKDWQRTVGELETRARSLES